MRKVIAIRCGSKKEVEETVRMAEEIDSRVEVIQALIPLGLESVVDELREIVTLVEKEEGVG